MNQYNEVIEELFTYSTEIRYVAFYNNRNIFSKQRHALSNCSSGYSDRMEELLVNATLLMLARQRGDIDCGGLRFIIVAYGNFYQLISEIHQGHVSVCLDKAADITNLALNILEYLKTEHPFLFKVTK